MAGVEVSYDCKISPGVALNLGMARGKKGRILIATRCELSRGVVVRAWGGSVDLGTNVFLGEYAVIYGHGGVTVGDDTLISMHCRILSSNHKIPLRDYRIRSQGDDLLPTRIGRDVWLGAGAVVLGGVVVGDGCVVGAGSVVSRDLPPYSIAVGIPARVIRERE